MKITIVVSASSWGGTEVHTVALARTLEGNGHEVCLLEVGSDLYAGIKFGPGVRVSAVHPGDAGALGRLGVADAVSMLRKVKGDVCIFPKSWFPSGSWRLDLAARVVFPRYLTIEHLASLPFPEKTRERHFYNLIPGVGLWWYLTKLDDRLRSLLPHRVVCVSEAVRANLIAFHGYRAQKVATIHNGIDTERFRPDPMARAKARKEWGIPQDALVYGALGRFDVMKGFDVALELFARLLKHAEGRNAWLILGGQGPDYREMKAVAESTQFNGRVRLLGFTDAPWEIYPAFDLFVMPSRNEGLPLSLLEAMACGCCPVAMGVGGIPEIVSGPSFGWVVEPNDRSGFFAAMKEAALSGADRLQEIGMTGRGQVVANFQASNQFGALARLIEKSEDQR